MTWIQKLDTEVKRLEIVKAKRDSKQSCYIEGVITVLRKLRHETKTEVLEWLTTL